jgi:hypothetical protein
MKTLIYTCAFGDAYWNLASTMVASLLRHLTVPSDVFILSDQDRKPPEGVRVVLPPREHGLSDAQAGKLAKTMVDSILPVANYDWVLCLDADIVFQGDLAEVLEKSATDRIWTLPGNRPWTQLDLSRQLLNSGFVLHCPSRFPEFLSRWSVETRKRLHASVLDQPALMETLRTHYPKSLGFVSAGGLRVRQDGDVLTHYCGKSVDQMILDHMVTP